MDDHDGDRKIQRYRRIALRTSAKISTIDPELEPRTGRPYFRTTEDTCANVSRGGAYIESDELVSPGRRVLVEIELPKGEQVRAVGRVLWSKTAVEGTKATANFGMGIEFVGAEDGELDRLEAALRSGDASSATSSADESSARSSARPPARA